MRTTPPWIVLLFVAGCAAGEIEPGAQDVPALAVHLAAGGGGADPWIEVTYENTSAQPLPVLRWTLPSEELWEDLFAVSHAGQRSAYVGRIYRRPDPRPEDYVWLAPGETRQGRVDLARLYELPVTGEYQVELAAAPASIHGPAATSRRLETERVSVFAEGRARPQPVEERYFGVQFLQCAGWQKQLLYEGMDWADYYADEAVQFMSQSPGNWSRYKRWFGNYSASRWNKVRSVFNVLNSRLDSKRMRLHCDCDDDYYAYVYPDQPYNIYICNVYWDASSDDKGGTIIHELSHFYAVAGTDDVVYGVSGCEQLASSNPGAAVVNADSYAYFCQLPD